MTILSALRSSKLITWKPTGKLQQTLAGSVERRGISLHSGKVSTVRLCPGLAGQGRYFDFRSNLVPASVEFAQVSPLCTTLCKDGLRIRTVEHLLSALEGAGVDNCRIQIENLGDQGDEAEIPIFDGSAKEWVEALEEVGLETATDIDGKSCEKIAPHVNEPMHVWRNDSFIAAFPSDVVQVTYGISFPQAPAIGCQWFSTTPLDDLVYSMQIALSRTFCIYEEVEQMRSAGLIKGGSLENAIVCSISKGWLNPPLRFSDEPCRHKILDLIGDLSLFAQFGSQGLPVAHIVAYKGGHALHVDLTRRLMGIT
ncbi:probable UDP-3-O-acyl-N-acetylglucosamine deacetylase 1, mitochondrial [Vicia villosa]|uniref:probable UDP-3-O-acyl-N-acetylglucosamine deacetylase 1, mitochondrial n=1 Tax=Vicia villosa TaxID=3911 RepID=UPI00273BF022|nr:probable UDP-3-O-acyl-N-acetylglucosamine deacetylase 1, mitochondrial [Vicia villosa]XP_058724438.1 probable UDP-3-O-acyl-N-acetylglucosamine deacetylase 1, mitochondrial [Vicia villosa]